MNTPQPAMPQPVWPGPTTPGPAPSWTHLYVRLLKASLHAQWQYRTDFLLGVATTVLLSLGELTGFAVILWRFHRIGGWGPAGIALLYGVTRLAYGLHRLGAGDLHRTGAYVRSGEYEGLLLRPCPPLFTLFCRSGRIQQLATLITPAAAAGIAIVDLYGSGTLRPWALACLPPLLMCAIAMDYAIGIATFALAFWLVRVDEFSVLTVDAPNTAAAFPLTAYPGWLRLYLTTAVPVGLTVFCPLRFLLGRGGSWLDLALAPPAAAAAVALALWLWRYGESRYMGTGT